MAIRQSIADKYHDLPLPVLDKVVAQKLPPESAARWMESTQASQAQGDVLGKLMGVVNEKGETADDRAAYLRMQNEAEGIANSAQSAVNRNMSSRGLGNSGMAFALQQQGGQSAVNRANAMGIQEASDARGRYMQALGLAGTVSGQQRGQDQNAMQAQDNINEFNARQQTDADRYNAGLNQQDFDNRAARLAGESNALNGVANTYDRNADATRQTGSGIGNAVITVGATYDQYGNKIPPKDPYTSSAGGR